MVKQAHNERNYHIFYQLAYGADKWLAQLLEIDKDVDYSYLRNDKNDHEDNFDDEVCAAYYKCIHTCIFVHFDLEFRLLMKTPKNIKKRYKHCKS